MYLHNIAEGLHVAKFPLTFTALASLTVLYASTGSRVQLTQTTFSSRFLESELDLHDEIQKLHVIATAPELYNILVQQNAIQTIFGLLSHENSDILVHKNLKIKCEKRKLVNPLI